MKYWFLLLLQFLIIPAFSQTITHLTGAVLNHKQEPLPDVTVRVFNSRLVSKTDQNGRYSLAVPTSVVEISFSKVGFKEYKVHLDLSGASAYTQDAILHPDNHQLDEVRVTAGQDQVITLNPTKTELIPSVSGNFESMLKGLPGVSTNNELSSQYSVRGGNFDENLIYINDVEFYRPFLVRNGQSEGLSFINPDLAGKVRFSAGGFEARYGDKMSSVLDVSYSRPDSTEYLVSPGLLGSSAAAKYLSNSGRAYLLAGLRHKSNRSLLQSQNTRGSYNPDFYDMQLVYNQEISKRLSVNFFGNYNLSKFTLTPVSSETSFGTATDHYNLEVFFEGLEKSRFENWMNALTWVFRPSEQVQFKWINSAIRIRESEAFDVVGQYLFIKPGAVGQSSPGLENRGVGSAMRFGDNAFSADIYASEAKAYLQTKKSFWEGGIKYQIARISDQIQEHTQVDSMRYGSPAPLTSLSDTVSAMNSMSTNTLSGYLQNSVNFRDKFSVTGGVRVNYNSMSSEILISPRFNLSYSPSGREGLLYRFSAGIYSQPAFFREMRYRDGSINQRLRAQRSIHLLGGMDKQFRWTRPLKLTSEVYYKALSNLVPYKIDNLRIQYLPGQSARGYAAGADLNLSGEFVKDLESSFRLSLMQTAEDIEGDFLMKKDPSGNLNRVEPGYLKRPTDQRLNISVFFQDKLFRSPEYKVHLNLLYGSALPIGPPQRERYEDIFSIPAYKRADIGFSKDLISQRGNTGPQNKYFKSLTIYAGVFNLLGNRNTISYLWLTDINNNQYAIPNHLTGRSLNLRLIGRIN